MKEPIHSRIHEIYRAIDRTQEYFGDQLGLSVPVVKTLFNGRKLITPEIIQDLHDKFWVDKKWLETGQGMPFPDGLPDNVAKAGDRIIGSRVRAFREHKKMTQEQLGAVFGIISTTRIESGGHALTEAAERKLVEMGISITWLRTGKGVMLTSGTEAMRFNVTVIDWAVMANPDAIPSQMTAMIDRVMWLPELPKGKEYFALKVAGDSMSDYYNDGDTIIVSKCEDVIFDKVYVVIVQGTGYLKRVRKVLAGPNKGHLELISENTRYQPIYVEYSDVSSLFEIHKKIADPK